MGCGGSKGPNADTSTSDDRSKSIETLPPPKSALRSENSPRNGDRSVKIAGFADDEGDKRDSVASEQRRHMFKEKVQESRSQSFATQPIVENEARLDHVPVDAGYDEKVPWVPKHAHKEILSQLEPGKQFCDDEFTPDFSSLAPTAGKVKGRGWEKLVWKRASEFLGDTMEVFEDKIEPDDIRQGLLGDCYFLGALSVLAEHPERIQNLFLTREYNEGGCYAVRIMKSGRWREMIVDDFFPCHADSNLPAFSRANGPELWVLILEKAWAKLHGSYWRIEAGTPNEALADLTGAPVRRYLVGKSDEKRESVWNALLDARQNRLMVTASVPGEPTVTMEDARRIDGLIEGHVYGVLTAMEAEGHKLIKLRNPWGNTEWTGAWSDKSDLWTPSMKEACEHVDADDGAFWMALEDFSTHFNRIHVCHWHDYWVHTAIDGAFPKHVPNAPHFLVKVEDSTDAYFTVHQKDRRLWKGHEKKPYYAVLISLYNVDTLEPVASSEYLEAREVWVQAKLEPGQYLCVIQSDNVFEHNEETVPFVFTAYSESEVHLVDVTGQQLVDEDAIAILRPAALERGKRQEYPGYPDICMIVYDAKILGTTIVCYKNETDNATLHEEITVQLDNMKIHGEHAGKERIPVTVGPGEVFTLVLYQENEKSTRYEWKYERASRVIENQPFDAYFASARDRGKKKEYSDGVAIAKYTLNEKGVVVIAYENETDEKTLRETLKLDIENMDVSSDHGAVNDAGNEVDLAVGPHSTACVTLVPRGVSKTKISMSARTVIE